MEGDCVKMEDWWGYRVMEMEKAVRDMGVSSAFLAHYSQLRGLVKGDVENLELKIAIQRYRAFRSLYEVKNSGRLAMFDGQVSALTKGLSRICLI